MTVSYFIEKYRMAVPEKLNTEKVKTAAFESGPPSRPPKINKQ